MKGSKMIAVLTALVLVITALLSSGVSAEAGESEVFSDAYRSSPYYTKLTQALESSKDKSVMERTLAAALSQEGYLNYATEGIDIDEAMAAGLIWTGAELRMNQDDTGNTEYTRWAQRFIMGRDEESQYADYDWCAIFTSWCMYQAGYYTREELRRYYYSYSADPRIFYDADSWIASFNFDQHDVYYVPKAHHKLDAMDWNTYYNVDVDPYDIPYKPGGIVFFSWDASGEYFDHVAIVVGYDDATHTLSYINGNANGKVAVSQMVFDALGVYTEEGYVPYAETIMGYADYGEILPLEPRELTVETPVIYWDKSAPAGLKIRTDTESVMARVYIDGAYHGSIIESNMVFHEGLLSIGKSELRDLPLGMNRLTLVFDDGEVDVTLYVTDQDNDPMGLLGDVDGDGEVTILDATAIQRMLARLAALDKVQQCLADTDRDGEASVLDATYIQRHLAKLSCPDGVGDPLA